MESGAGREEVSLDTIPASSDDNEDIGQRGGVRGLAVEDTDVGPIRTEREAVDAGDVEEQRERSYAHELSPRSAYQRMYAPDCSFALARCSVYLLLNMLHITSTCLIATNSGSDGMMHRTALSEHFRSIDSIRRI